MWPASVKSKFSRRRNQRRALLRGLAVSLIRHQRLTTTQVRARAVVPFVEKLITKAKKADLANRRLVIARLGSVSAGHKLVDQIAPKLTGRTSGHLRIRPAGFRTGDNSRLAEVSFVDDLTRPAGPDKKSTAAKPAPATETSNRQPAVKSDQSGK